ncbi:DUF742 domain-containing protein [Sciscionella sediminilitoris]|uniref:DUF742 domain-containing protein n=1 Tax=Sciscionella sediminilitoris TaxID=1445613 RepID=UPI003CCCD007
MNEIDRRDFGTLAGRIDVDPAAFEPTGGQAVPEQAKEPFAHTEPGPQGFLDEPSGNPELVRPYFRTKGRTRPGLELSIEALVSTSHRGLDSANLAVPEHRSICELCVDTRSVAEVAAFLRLPLGVARVLIGDVAAAELVVVHTATHMAGDRPSIDFMERVLSGLRTV